MQYSPLTIYIEDFTIFSNNPKVLELMPYGYCTYYFDFTEDKWRVSFCNIPERHKHFANTSNDEENLKETLQDLTQYLKNKGFEIDTCQE